MLIEDIRKAFRLYHLKDGYREEHHVRMDNEAFPHTFNASGLENQIKNIVDKGVKTIEDKLFCIQPCFRRFDLDNIDKNGYSLFFQMCGKCYFTEHIDLELKGYFIKHIDFLVDQIGLDSSKFFYTIFGGGKIAKIGDAQLPEDTRSKEILLDIGISLDKIVSIKNSQGKGEIDNFLVRFERGWEKYAGYGVDIYYDLGDDKQLGESDIKPGNVKGGRFLEISTTRICDLWRTSEYGEEVTLVKSPMPSIVSGLSLERLAFITQNVPSIFHIDSYKNLYNRIKEFGFDDMKIKKFIALLVPLYYIISEGNIPGGSNTGKNRDLRHLTKNVFDTFDTFEWLLNILQQDANLESKRKELFKDMSFKEKIFYSNTYSEIIKIYNKTYDTLVGKHSQILDIIINEKIVYLEDKYKKTLK